MSFRARPFLFRLLRAASFWLVALPFAVLAQGRFVPQYPEDLVTGAHATEQREARAELLAGKTVEAVAHFTKIAAAYESEGRLQEAAWTYAQIGRADKSHELTEQLLAKLANGHVVSNVAIGIGVTASKRITFEDGSMAIFKNVDDKTEVAAYLVDRFLGLNLVPATVLRDIPGLGLGSVQVWIGGAQTADRFATFNTGNFGSLITSSDLFFLDVLLDNTDRHSGNYMIREGNYLVAIDQGRTFGYGGLTFIQRTTPSNPIPRREVYERLIALDDETSRALLQDVLNETQILRFQGNRRAMISRIEALIAQFGAEATFRGDEVTSSKVGAESRSLQKMIRNQDWRALALRTRHSPEFHANLLREFPSLKREAQTKAFQALASSPAEENALLSNGETRKAVARHPELLVRAAKIAAGDPELWRELLSSPGAWSDPGVQQKLMSELPAGRIDEYVLGRLGGPGTDFAAVAEFVLRHPSVLPGLLQRWPQSGLQSLVTLLDGRGRWGDLLDAAFDEMRGSAWATQINFLLTLSPNAQAAVLKRLRLPASQLYPFVSAYNRNVRTGLLVTELTGRVDLKILSLPLFLADGVGREDWAGLVKTLRELPENRFPEVWKETLPHLRLNAIAREPAIFARLIEKAGDASQTVDLAGLATQYLGDPETQALASALARAEPATRGRLARELRERVSVPIEGGKVRVIFPQVSEADHFRRVLELVPTMSLVVYGAMDPVETLVLASGGLTLRLPNGQAISWRDLLRQSRNLGYARKLVAKEKIPALEQAQLERILGVRAQPGWNLRERFAPRGLAPNRCDAVFGGT